MPRGYHCQRQKRPPNNSQVAAGGQAEGKLWQTAVLDRLHYYVGLQRMTPENVKSEISRVNVGGEESSLKVIE